jgi:hypothetical protein
MRFNAATQGMCWIAIAKWSVFTWDRLLQLRDGCVSMQLSRKNVKRCHDDATINE